MSRQGDGLVWCNSKRIEDKDDLDSRWRGGWKTYFTIVACFGLGIGALFLFVTPQEILEAFSRLDAASMGWALVALLVGSWAAVLRWWHCLEKDVRLSLAGDTFGVAQAGNLLLPGRVGEPLRVFLLSRCGSTGPKATSALVQERMNEQVLRFGFLLVVLAVGAGDGGELRSKAAWAGGMAVALAIALILSVKYSTGVSKGIGAVCNRLPYLSRLDVESLLHRTLVDLGRTAWSPSGRRALFWGLMCWVACAVHTGLLVRLFVENNFWVLAVLVVAVAPPTSPTQAGLYHGMVAGALYLFSVPKVEALGIAILLHVYQTVLYVIWGGIGWVRVGAEIRKAPQKAVSVG